MKGGGATEGGLLQVSLPGWDRASGACGFSSRILVQRLKPVLGVLLSFGWSLTTGPLWPLGQLAAAKSSSASTMDTTPPAGAEAVASEGAAGGGVVHQPDVQQLLPSAGGPARLGFNQETAVQPTCGCAASHKQDMGARAAMHVGT